MSAHERETVIACDGSPASPALAAALEMIARAGRHAPHAVLKRNVRDAFALGPTDRQVLARYAARTMAWRGLDLTAAIAGVERAYRDEILAHRRSTAFGGRSDRPRLALMVLGELRLIMRWLRRHRDRGAVPASAHMCARATQAA